ncbi:MAG: hypothetical protein ACOY3P_10565 [Planctomycetota bacterium]
MSLFSRLTSLFTRRPTEPDPFDPVLLPIRENRCRRVLEVGLGDAKRATRIVQTIASHASAVDASYVGFDLFELAPAERPTVPLKAAYLLLRPCGVPVRLVPGDPLPTLARHANELGQVDAVLFTHDLHPDTWPRAWFYLPRLLHSRSIVLLERCLEGVCRWESIDLCEIRARAETAMRRAA